MEVHTWPHLMVILDQENGRKARTPFPFTLWFQSKSKFMHLTSVGNSSIEVPEVINMAYSDDVSCPFEALGPLFEFEFGSERESTNLIVTHMLENRCIY